MSDVSLNLWVRAEQWTLHHKNGQTLSLLQARCEHGSLGDSLWHYIGSGPAQSWMLYLVMETPVSPAGFGQWKGGNHQHTERCLEPKRDSDSTWAQTNCSIADLLLVTNPNDTTEIWFMCTPKQNYYTLSSREYKSFKHCAKKEFWWRKKKKYFGT